MKINISRLTSYLAKEEELDFEFFPQHLELTISRKDVFLTGDSVRITKCIDMAELCQVRFDLMELVFRTTLDVFRKKCHELGLPVSQQPYRMPNQAEWEAAHGFKFLAEIQNHPPRAKDYLNQGKPPKPKKLPPPPPQEPKK